MEPRDLIILILLWPALGALINGFTPPRVNSRRFFGLVGCISVALGFATAVALVWAMAGSGAAGFERSYFSWIPVGDLVVDFGLRLDPLSAVMALVVTGVGLLIHIYSIGYMGEDPGFRRYFVYMNLFTFMMLTLVLANNFVLMFVGWEGVGLCSYLLIGFWLDRESATRAGLKAFLVNRIGDFGFILALTLIYSRFHSLNIQVVMSAIAQQPDWVIFWISLLLFVGAVGKSAQIPLYVWLPDAMEGPTPVSALIHAATMVTAGVYLVVRCAALYSLPASAQGWVAWIGALTAIFSATIALAQTDIKRVLAYSTISQLGYMFLAAGVGAYTAAIFHLVTHAFFKAGLFLGAGSVMHALHGKTDISGMGGLKPRMRTTWGTFLVACLAIAGIPGLSGFFSKDEILYETFRADQRLWMIGVATALLTAFYMFRVLYLTFYGKPRASRQEMERVHESPPVMTVPLVALAFLAILGGALGLPDGAPHFLRGFLSPVLPRAEAAPHTAAWMEWGLMAFSAAIAIVGIAIAFTIYIRRPELAARAKKRAGWVHTLLSNKWYVDELYFAVIVGPLSRLADFLGNRFDPRVIDGAVNGVAHVVDRIGEGTRRIQTSNVRSYALAMTAGAVIALGYLYLTYVMGWGR